MPTARRRLVGDDAGSVDAGALGGAVETAVFLPREHDALDVPARLVEGDLFNPGLEVACAPRLPPLPYPGRTGVVGGHGQAWIFELAQQPGQKGGADFQIRA